MNYLVKAINDRSEIVALEFNASSPLLAKELAARQGLRVLSLRPTLAGWFGSTPVRSRFSSTLLSVELLSLLDAGLNLVEAIQALTEKTSQSEARRILEQVLDGLREGMSLSQSLSRLPQHFSPLYIATIRSSEQTGNVKEALSRYIAYQDEIDRVRKKVASALVYPAILLTVGGLVLSFLLFYVVPRFARVYEDISRDLPVFSKALLYVGRTVAQHGWLVAALIGGMLIAIAYVATDRRMRAAIVQRLWRIPSVGERIKAYQLARVYRTLGMLLRAGIPFVRAAHMVEDLLADHLRAQLASARKSIEEGVSLSAALTTTGLASPVANRMLVVGERGGQIGDMLERIARFYDDETSRFVDWFTRLLEPALMAILGLAVGGVVVLMYMPIFELAGAIQ
ncbi:MAG TPA: type II secretion system F family protein [Burkholderiales bacterium]|nr:type II secretion system F family protein [Burkholderiales bacterium]